MGEDAPEIAPEHHDPLVCLIIARSALEDARASILAHDSNLALDELAPYALDVVSVARSLISEISATS
jgi:hypothetical protein